MVVNSGNDVDTQSIRSTVGYAKQFDFFLSVVSIHDGQRAAVIAVGPHIGIKNEFTSIYQVNHRLF